MLQVGSILGGRFRVDRLLGAGGMGMVVAATHVELEQPVAIKVLHDELATNPTIVARFLREARAVAKLRTEHVCRVFDVGRLDNGAPFIVMELLDGNDLGSVVVRGPLPPPLAAEYVIQACVALAEAHAAGIVHRDLKPANLFVTRRADGGRLVKVLDFGIAKAATAAEAKLTHTTSTIGSPGYMSPEQIKSARDVDLRTDIWALGVTLYQLLSGRMPFGGTQLAEIAVNITTLAPAPLDVDPGLRAIVMRCLDKAPERRYPDVASLAAALLPYAGPPAASFVQQITGVHAAVAPAAPLADTAAPTVAARAAPAAARDGRTRSRRSVWLPVAVIAALFGGGLVLAALSSRSSPEHTVATPGSAETGSTAIDASTPAVAAVVDAGDPWAERAAPPPDAALADEPDTSDAASAKDSDSSTVQRGDPRMRAYRTQILQSLDSADMALKMFENEPAKVQQALRGLVTTACAIGDVARAQRYFDKLAGANHRVNARRECKRYNVPLVDRGTPPATGSAAPPAQ